MAAEMSCLTGVDEDDADPEINALTLMQEPLRMAQESASCTDSLSKNSVQTNSVLHVLSSADMLSSVGLGNGPSVPQATQAQELTSISTQEEEAESITPLKTVQIDTAGIWGFDADSPENSLDNFHSSGDLHWDPHKEFMQFLWENHGDSPGEEPEDEVPPTNSQRRRKRKMDMVVMVDPSEDLHTDLSHKSSEDPTDADGRGNSVPVGELSRLPDLSKSQSSPTVTVSKYPNGTVKAIKGILYNSPAQESQENSLCRGLSPLKRRLTANAHAEKKPPCYPCSTCKLVFRKQHHLHRHMTSHADLQGVSPKAFICRECGQSFALSDSLIEHMSVHQEKRDRLAEDSKSINDRKDSNAKLFCPQCPFVTTCPNVFVKHAKTHEKDKRKFRCDQCSFRSLSEDDLRRHQIVQHSVVSARKQVPDDESGIFSCEICSYRAFSRNIFKNHLLRRHQQTLEEYQAAQRREKNAQTSKEPRYKTPVGDAEFTSQISIKNQISSKRAYSPSDAGDISDLFRNSRIRRSLKSHLTESKLDKSINVLLSRQRHGKKAVDQKKDSIICNVSVQQARCDQSPGNLTDEEPSSSPSHPKLPASAARRDPNTPTALALRKSPSKRKMSTPYHNTSDSCFTATKPLPSPGKISLEENKMLAFNDADASVNLCENGLKSEKPNIIYTYSRRMSMRGALQASKRLFEKIKSEEQEQSEPEIKEENMESEVCQEPAAPHLGPRDPFPEDELELDTDRKNCPYCPAVFESGVGLSNHVRGHLHRVGLNYNARHVVSPEQVACQDRRPRVRRKISALRRLKQALQLDLDSEAVRNVHSCPLCGDSFDNRTGQSNHIRGHLKKLGKSIAAKNKSPLVLLRELMRDKKELQRALQILGKRRNLFQYGTSPKLPGADCFTSLSMGIPRDPSDPNVCTDSRPLMPSYSLANLESEEGQQETKLDVKHSLSGTSALIGILKKRKCQEEARIKGSSWISRNMLASSNSEHSSGSRVTSSLPKYISEKGEFNRKVCVHCNATFHSGVSLSNHLRAYAKRKRTALLEGTTFDCKVRRQRSRPGSKKKTPPLPQTPEEMYRLTCRFCDLVFQGPLSVQEDWIKHLQRHIMSTSVPHTGLGMVEVSPLPPTPQPDRDSPPASPTAS